MRKLYFLFGIHNHQPVDNFDHVMAEGFEKCYAPLLEGLKKHPGVRISLHHSGSLLEWIQKHKPFYLDIIGELVSRNQVEIMGGGFYEPILPVIPEQDALDQIQRMTDFCRKEFGYIPRGGWLAERIWDPRLPGLLSKAGLHYTVVDDTHFDYAGLMLEKKLGFFMTESRGRTVAVFPIDKVLRYKIPFRMPDEVIAYLRQISDEHGEVGITYADDGEKLGLWPGTHKWVYGEAWLEKFFTALEENASWICMLTFSEYLETFQPTGKIYLPPASYEEMMEWALFTDAADRFHDILTELKESGSYERYKPFIRGGLWNNFLLKYPESNRMHKKMLYVSNKLSLARGRCKDKVQEERLLAPSVELWRGQCNCGYWHGLFGGLYLSHLRHSIYSRLIAADKALDAMSEKQDGWIRVHEEDYDADGENEVIVECEAFAAYIAPSRGGTLVELDLRHFNYNFINTLSRRREAYHRQFTEERTVQTDEGIKDRPTSIHDLERETEEGLMQFLTYDRYERTAFLDRFMPRAITFEEYLEAGLPEYGDFLEGRYLLKSARQDRKKGTAVLEMAREGSITIDGSTCPLSLVKQYKFQTAEPSIEVSWVLTSLSDKPLDFKMGGEINFSLLTDMDEGRYLCLNEDARKIPLHCEGSGEKVKALRIKDEEMGVDVQCRLDEAGAAWWYPVKTVSRSENGLEGTYQGSAVIFLWDFLLPPHKTEKKTVVLKLG